MQSMADIWYRKRLDGRDPDRNALTRSAISLQSFETWLFEMPDSSGGIGCRRISSFKICNSGCGARGAVGGAGFASPFSTTGRAEIIEAKVGAGGGGRGVRDG